MIKYTLTDVFIIENSLDGKSQKFIKINEESPEYQAIKTETNNFTENMDYPKSQVEILQETVDQLVLDSLGV